LVTFHLGDEIIETQRVAYQEYAEYVSRSRDWYTFDAWYTDSDYALEHKYNFWKVTW
jgi:hypothetical protein